MLGTERVCALNDDGFLAAGKLHMLWVGINRYESPLWPTLKNAVSGSEALEEALGANFGLEDEDVVRLVNQAATLADIEMAVRAYGPGGPKEIEEEDHLIISFAGHGEEDQLTRETAFVPYDGNPSSPSTWFRFDHLRPLLRAISARHILVISDSCFSGGVFRGSAQTQAARGNPAYAKRAFSKFSRQMISSGGSELTDDGGGRPGYSVFIDGLVHSLKSSNSNLLLANELFYETRNFVVANAEQTPEFGPLTRSGHAGGEFIFFRQNTENREQIGHISGGLTGAEEQPISAHQADDHAAAKPVDLPEIDLSAQTHEAQGENVGDALAAVDASSACVQTEGHTAKPETHSVFQQWTNKKSEIFATFGQEFELHDEVDINEFSGILTGSSSEQHQVARPMLGAPLSLTFGAFIFCYVNLTYVSFNLWLSDALTLGAIFFPLLGVVPLVFLYKGELRKTLGASFAIFVSFLATVAITGPLLEDGFGIRADQRFLSSATSAATLALFLELSIFLAISTITFRLAHGSRLFWRVFIALFSGTACATVVFYLVQYGQTPSQTLLDSTRAYETAPLLGQGPPASRYLSWMVRDVIVYSFLSFATALVARPFLKKAEATR
jgi:hypothetical protein